MTEWVCSGMVCRDSNCCVFPSCNATQPATINLLSRNVGGPRIPIKSSTVCECVCSVYVHVHKVLRLPVNISIHPDIQTSTPLIWLTNNQLSIWGHAVATTNGITAKLGSNDTHSLRTHFVLLLCYHGKKWILNGSGADETDLRGW